MLPSLTRSHSERFQGDTDVREGERGENDSHHGVGVSSSIPPLYITRVRDFAWRLSSSSLKIQKVTRPGRRDHVTRTKQGESGVLLWSFTMFVNHRFSQILNDSSFRRHLNPNWRKNWDKLVYAFCTGCGSSLAITSSLLLPEMVGDCVRRPFWLTTFDHLCWLPDSLALVFGECEGVGWFISIPMVSLCVLSWMKCSKLDCCKTLCIVFGLLLLILDQQLLAIVSLVSSVRSLCSGWCLSVIGKFVFEMCVIQCHGSFLFQLFMTNEHNVDGATTI